MTAVRPAARTGGPVRSSLWRHVLVRVGPEWAAVRYATLVRARAAHADPSVFAGSAREDASRLAAALSGVLDLHHSDGRSRCAACSIGPYRVDWPCRTRRAVEDGLRNGWPTPADLAEPEEGAPGPHEGFALAVLASHDILPAAGGRPAICRACQLTPDRCPVWALAEGFLGLTWTNPAGDPGRAAGGVR